MSEAHDNAAAEHEKSIQELKDKFAKKDKLIALATDDQELFAEVVSSYGDNIKDWTEGADEKAFTGLVLAKSENGRMVLVPVASPEAVFSNPTVRQALYKIYVNRVANAATDDETQQSQFIVVDGNFKQKFDLDAFKFLARGFVKKLREQGLNGMTIAGLRQSFASQAFAQTAFPRTKKEQWEKLLNMAMALAKANNHDVGLYEHWLATRDVQTADTSTLDLDFASFTKTEEDADEQAEQTAEQAAQ